MKFFSVFLFFFNFLSAKSYILGLEDEVKKDPKYSKLKNNTSFKKANIIVVITEINDFAKNSIRPSRNIFGYSQYLILIYQKEKLIYKKTLRLSCFNEKNRNNIVFNEKKQLENRKKVADYTLNLLSLSDFLKEINKQISRHKLDEPTSNLIFFNENGKIKAISTNFKEFSSEVKNAIPLTIIPTILNQHDIKIVKFERIFNHGIYSYITIDNTLIKLPNKNYFQNLYKTLLKIEYIYLLDKEIFNKDSSIFFTEFDKLENKNIEELIKLIKTKKKGF
ncbi:hypothetical protein [Alphaproteobacteria bacterium endosymbiont of Tiliacea citrago]|uniref:hypothetical protein n=1 Tax=Alphaproteobacteria bacterium endosymbiont of Tiliacea citrago TaxID=3077944 RepID=UPI00313DD965